MSESDALFRNAVSNLSATLSTPARRVATSDVSELEVPEQAVTPRMVKKGAARVAPGIVNSRREG